MIIIKIFTAGKIPISNEEKTTVENVLEWLLDKKAISKIKNKKGKELWERKLDWLLVISKTTMEACYKHMQQKNF